MGLDPKNEKHIEALACAMFDHEPRNNGKRFAEASQAVRFRLIDKAAWCLSLASQTLAQPKASDQ